MYKLIYHEKRGYRNLDNNLNLNLKDMLNMLQITYEIKGKPTIITDRLFGFMQKDNTIMLINPDTLKPFNYAYSIRYFDGSIIILSRKIFIIQSTTIVIELSTFELLYETNNYLMIENDLVYETPGTNALYNKSMNILNLRFKTLYTAAIFSKIALKAINNEYYLLSYNKIIRAEEHKIDEIDIDSNDYYEILHYDKQKDTLKSLYKSNKYEIDIVSEGICIFNKRHDYEILYMYDFTNKKMLSEQL